MWLIIIFQLAGAQPEARAVGLMIDAQTCAFAGAAMVAALKAANPSMAAAYACRPNGQEV